MAAAIRYEALDGKHCVLTGATAGIGRAAATALVRAGAGLTIVARSAAKAEAVRAELARSSPGSRLDVVLADFASLSQVRRAAAEVLERTPRIDILFNNAGVINLRYSETEDGYETTFAVNHLGPFLFTNLLLERLCETPGARIVMTTSDAHKHVRPLDFDDLHLRKKYSVAQAYGRSKAANILFIQELARRLAGTGVTANSFHPGFVRTDMGANHGPWAKLLLKVISPFANSPKTRACCSPRLPSSRARAAATTRGTRIEIGEPTARSDSQLDDEGIPGRVARQVRHHLPDEGGGRDDSERVVDPHVPFGAEPITRAHGPWPSGASPCCANPACCFGCPDAGTRRADSKRAPRRGRPCRSLQHGVAPRRRRMLSSETRCTRSIRGIPKPSNVTSHSGRRSRAGGCSSPSPSGGVASESSRRGP